ncbi:hypothetical protein COLO4_18731 [Corchorus olitorius]|uniref:START domain-containing protein n=1 Tax=Corchorus olitorius TaxID=93759 RepID=A0A1R3J815_9ROSI|nr:hypothetical protein COLO4_18731 [Corchorus olitorius]
METTMVSKKAGGEGGHEKEGSDGSTGSSSSDNNNNNNINIPISGGHKHNHSRSISYDEKGIFEYFGWVYHIGVNSIGHEYCHLRFLFIKGKYVEMYKRDPHENPGIRPIRRGVIGPSLMVEELGRRKVGDGDLYVIQFYSRLDEAKKGEWHPTNLLLFCFKIACSTAGEARKWMEAFDHAKQQAEYELSKGGPEMLLRQTSNLAGNGASDGYFEGEFGDALEAHEWKCVRTINGVRIFEDVSDSKSGKGSLVKAVALVDASADTAFDIILNLDRHRRYEWDMLTGDLELVDSYDGHYDVVYGTYDPKYLTRWQSKRDFVFSRQWFRGQDGEYTILQFPAVHKKRPPRSGYRRTTINPSTWEIRSLNTPMGSDAAKCLVTQMLEIHSAGWCRWKKNSCSKFEKTIPYALLNQVSGLKEYIGANPSLKCETSAMVVQSKFSDVSISSSDFEDVEVQDEFYDAIAGDSSTSSEDEDNEGDANEGDANKGDANKKERKVKLKNVSWAITSLALKRAADPDANKELDPSATPVNIDASQFNGSLHKGTDEADSNCWTCPSGRAFKIRGKTYLKDNAKVMGGDPLLQLIAVDWFKVDKATDKIALHPKCLVQSDAGKKLPFILVINLEVPAKPNYSLVLYYAAERPVNKDSLLGKFVDGTDMFRDARFKLIPSIVEGYWMVKRAVGTKACLLGKAVTCRYFRQDNFLEIDVDIGSSSVARSVIGLVLGYVTSLVVDLAILIEGKEEAELPEYILGTVRLNRVKPESAIPLEA